MLAGPLLRPPAPAVLSPLLEEDDVTQAEVELVLGAGGVGQHAAVSAGGEERRMNVNIREMARRKRITVASQKMN